MPKFLVVSYDQDEQQMLYDTIEAPAASLAMQIVEAVRDYAEVLDTWSVEDWRETMSKLEDPEYRCSATRAALNEELNGDNEFCRTCDANLLDDAGEGYDGECGSCADKSEAKRPCENEAAAAEPWVEVPDDDPEHCGKDVDHA